MPLVTFIHYGPFELLCIIGFLIFIPLESYVALMSLWCHVFKVIA